jgi:hypothetical protein
MLGSNAQIHIKRSGGPDFSGTETFYSVKHKVDVRFASRRSSTVGADGIVVATDADMQMSSCEDIELYDIVVVLGSTKIYRVESIEDVQNANGRVVGYDIQLSRAEDLE